MNYTPQIELLPSTQSSGLATHGKRVWFYGTVDLVAALEREEVDRIAASLLRLDLVSLEELVYLPFSQAGGALLFHLMAKLYTHASVVITTAWTSLNGPPTSATPR